MSTSNYKCQSTYDWESNSKYLLGKERLQRALDCSEIRPWFQPKLDLEAGKLYGLEALARWHLPGGSIVGPQFFLPLIEQFGLEEKLLITLIEQAFEELQRSKFRAPEVAFNASADVLCNIKNPHRLQEAISKLSERGINITFELTESGQLLNFSNALWELELFREMGCGLSMDDFGAGYSSLSRLSQLPFTEIKLDRDFIGGKHNQSRCDAIIHSTLDLGRNLDLPVVVEGVESHEQHLRLTGMNCRYVQGYYYSPPLPASELGRLDEFHPL